MAESPDGTFLVNAYTDPVVVKINGRASYLNVQPYSKFLSNMLEHGKRNFVVDFENCAGMDSTFLGITARAAQQTRSAQPRGRFVLCGLSPRNLELVRNLGLHHLLEIEECGPDVELPDARENLKREGGGDEKENARLILEAHESLVKADGNNQAKFQDVISFLKNQLEDS